MPKEKYMEPSAEIVESDGPEISPLVVAWVLAIWAKDAILDPEEGARLKDEVIVPKFKEIQREIFG